MSANASAVTTFSRVRKTANSGIRGKLICETISCGVWAAALSHPLRKSRTELPRKSNPSWPNTHYYVLCLSAPQHCRHLIVIVRTFEIIAIQFEFLNGTQQKCSQIETLRIILSISGLLMGVKTTHLIMRRLAFRGEESVSKWEYQ